MKARPSIFLPTGTLTKSVGVSLLGLLWAALLPALAAPSPLVINEIQPINLNCTEDGRGELEPWIEIYNRSTNGTVSLENYFLSTNYSQLARWRFPQGSYIGPGEFLLVWADGEPQELTQREWHTSFRLPQDRGSVALSQWVNGKPEVVDFANYDYGEVGPDLSLGLYPDGQVATRQLLLHCSPGGDNVPAPLTVLINEWQPQPVAGGFGWFELYNPANKPVTLSGRFLTDTPNAPTKFQIPPGRIIPPKGFMRVWADNDPGRNASDPVDLHVNFKMGLGFLGIYATPTWVVDAVNYSQLPAGVIVGRFPDGAKFNYTSSFATPRLPNAAPPRIIQQPADLVVVAGSEAAFKVMALGTERIGYEWHHNNAVIVPMGGPELRLPRVKLSDAGYYYAVLTNRAGSLQSATVTLTVLEPPAVQIYPVEVVVSPGKFARFLAEPSGTPPYTFQWRRNGVNIPGATDDGLTIQAAQLPDGGAYEVVVANAAGVAASEPARLILDIPGPDAQDNFDRPAELGGERGTIGGLNRNASSEPGEPIHAGQPGGKSVWYSWVPPFAGVATFETRGSLFDTLLAVYVGDRVERLTEVASDDERGGFHTSRLRFNAEPKVEYKIAVDGFAGAEGHFVLNWILEDGNSALPQVVVPPLSQTVKLGSPVTLRIVASPASAGFQWLHNGQRIPQATEDVLFLSKIRPEQVGFYSVLVYFERNVIESQPATVEIGTVMGVQSEDKRASLRINDPPSKPFGALHNRSGLMGGGGSGFVSVSMGTIVPHILSNETNSVTDLGEVCHCDVVTRATRWIDFQTENNGVCLVTAQGGAAGSEFATLVAVYAIEDFDELKFVACATNSPGMEPAYARFDARAGAEYLAVVDGINGGTGVITIEWLLGNAPTINQATVDYLVDEGDNLSFGLEATGWIPSPDYQWRLEGASLPSANSSSIDLIGIGAEDGGSYAIVVSNVIGTVTNTVANVSVEIPLLIRLQTTNSPPEFATLTGAASQAYRVLSSTNLECWTTLTLISNSPFALNHAVPIGANPPAQYFRASPWPMAPWDEPSFCGEESP